MAALTVFSALVKPRPTSAQPAFETGVFRPTSDQLRSLTVVAVEARAFDQIEVADGRIEADGDKTTPVVSPFTGRVIEVLAEPGQRVTRKTPLFAVAATELAQGQADLASAVGAVATAQAQLKLAEETEQRQGELYRHAGGALKDYGQAIAAGGEALFSVSDLSTVWLVAQIPEASAGKVRLGAEVTLTTSAYPGRVFRAKVGYIAPSLDPDTHRLPVRATIANADGALKPDMFARVRIDSGGIGRSPAVPDSAVIREGDTARVWVLGADGTLRVRPVVAGVDQDGMVQIAQGLTAGEKVVSRGALFVDQAGQPD